MFELRPKNGLAKTKKRKGKKQMEPCTMIDKKTGISCGLNKWGELFLGDDRSGSTLMNSPENQKKIIQEFNKRIESAPAKEWVGKQVNFVWLEDKKQRIGIMDKGEVFTENDRYIVTLKDTIENRKRITAEFLFISGMEETLQKIFGGKQDDNK